MIGLDVSDRSLKMIELEDGPNQKLRTACWSALPPNVIRRGIIQDPARATAALKELMTKCTPLPLAGNMVVASIPETRSFLRVIDLPRMNEAETDEAVKWAIRQHIPFDLDRVYLDWQPIISNGELSRQQVLVGAAQREVIDPLLNVLDNLGLEVVALELEAQALVRSMLPYDNTDIRSILVVDLGATSTNVIYFDRGAMRFTASIPHGGDDLTQQLVKRLQLQPSIAAEKKALVGVRSGTAEAQVSETLRDAARSLVQQISQAVQEPVATDNQQNPLSAILLGGGAANLPGLAEIFAEFFPAVPVQLGNPLINISIEEKTTGLPLSPNDAAHFSTAIGLALRQPEAKQNNYNAA